MRGKMQSDRRIFLGLSPWGVLFLEPSARGIRLTRMARGTFFLWLASLTATSALWAQQPRVDDLLQKSAAARKTNEPKTKQYLYREYVVSTHLNEKGEPSNRHTETWEAISLEGSEYRKLIQRDDRPLTAKEQKQEDERLRAETERRRKPKTGGSRNPISRTYTFSFSVGDDRFFDFRYAGEETFNGRPAYVLEGTPKPDLKPANDHEKQMLVSRLKRWIDKEEFSESGTQLDVVGEGGDARPGSLMVFNQQRMGDGTWLLRDARILFILKPLRIANIRQETTITRSDYRKFVTDSRIVEFQ